ncbi:zinc ribbon domain-containing protein [Acholeplasma laidlawii]|uniref:zinc ribbon domain-containing protein n=1 Tax=Acholeplasma laidlawii TaxID=2148 RepID=UPI0018C1F870|nr:zinc ribbon domain-containing protein [Acholeplasma laidlawii]MBG0762192.1 zinc ribbon domain-containing protein [Acholeplasma laidlawii]
MGKNVLAFDEVILLEDGDISYSGSVDGLDYLDKITLTNKRIIAQWSKKKEEKKFEVQLTDIKIYNNELQVDYFEHDEIGDCLRIQTINGIESFSLNNIKDESIVNSFRKMFSSKSNSNEYKTVMLWVDKIKEATLHKKTNPSTALKQEHNIQSKEIKKIIVSDKEVITCTNCGDHFDKISRFCPSCGTSVEKPKVIEVEKVVEVIRCRICGSTIGADTKFCSSCGTSVIDKNKEDTIINPVIDIKKPREKSVHKCIICGEILPSDSLKCPSCGNEVRGRKTVISVREFFDKISSIDDENKKIEAIKLYPIPNNKEDITEFMFLASSSFDAEYYVTNKQGDSIANAWYTKIEQCYKKTVMMFTNPSDIQIVEKIYKEVQMKTENIKRNKFILSVTGTALIIISVILIGVSPRTEDGTAKVTFLSYISFAIMTIGIISLVLGLKKKKTNRQIEEEKYAKANKKNKR